MSSLPLASTDERWAGRAIRVPVLILAFTVALAAQPQSHPATGKAIFEGKGACLRCHSIENRGGSLGPDLSGIGLLRTPQSLRQSVTDPNAEISDEYLTVVVVTSQGKQVEGIALNADDISIQLRDAQGNLWSFLRDNLKEARREQRSLMPSYNPKLSAAEIDSVVAYLRTLRGDSPAPSGEPARKREAAPLTINLDWITRANRDSQERPDSLLDALEIPPGATVADVGAGAGYFTWRLAQRVGTHGKVIAEDIQQSMLDLITNDISRRQLTNVEVVLGTATDPRLPEHAVDLVLLANAYHEFSEPEAMMASIRQSLKPGARVVVVEYAKEHDEGPVAGLYTMSLADLRAEIEPLGFELDRLLDFLPIQHALIFTASDPK
jgi:putative heme-binding domain-containing protein